MYLSNVDPERGVQSTKIFAAAGVPLLWLTISPRVFAEDAFRVSARPGGQHEFHFVVGELVQLQNNLSGFGQIEALALADGLDGLAHTRNRRLLEKRAQGDFYLEGIAQG